MVKNFRFDASNAWGHINIFAKGAGHAVAQLDVNYGVDYEPFKVNSFSVIILYLNLSVM